MKKTMVLLLALMLAFAATATGEGTVYESEAGYALTLPGGWFKLDEQTYADTKDGALALVYAGMGITEETVAAVAEGGVEYFFNEASPSANINVQLQAAMTQEQIDLMLQTLQTTYEQMGATDFNSGEIEFGENAYAGCEFSLLGQTMSQFMACTDAATYILTYTNCDSADVEAMLAGAAFA